MSRPKGIKNGEGVHQRLLAFFEVNRGEWMTYEDMMVKFSCSRRTISYAMKYLREQGVIEVAVIVRGVGGTNV